MDSGSGFGPGFASKEVRRQFVRKVYMILSIQLAITTVIIGWFSVSESAKDWVDEQTLTVASAVFFLTYLPIVCCPELRRRFPANMVLLGVFTLALAFMTGAYTLFYETQSVMIAAVICTVCCIAVTSFSFNTKIDITEYAGIMLVLLLGLITFGLVLIFWGEEMHRKLYAGLGAVLFMMYLALDTQMIMGGKKMEIDPEEHIYAALILYMDIIILFRDMLRLMGNRRR